jgi:MFS family permease
MRKTTTEERTKTASSADEDRDLKNFPLLQTRAATALMARSRTVHVLLSSSPAFRLLMFGSSISMLGTRISTVAFPMLVLHLDNSPFVTGLVAFAAIAPSMLVYVPAGVLVDRWNPRRVMLGSELLRGLAIASVVIALIIFRMHVDIWFLILAMVAEEILEIFSTLADRRYLSTVIERDKVVSRQASVEVRTHAAVLAGRPVGPFLFAIEPFLPFLADAVSFIASVASLLLLRRIDEPPGEVRRLKLRQVIGDVGRGFEWLKRDRRAWLTVGLMATTSMVAQALIMMFLVEAHSKQLSTVAIGVVLATSGAGGAVGAFSSRIVPTEVRNYWLPIQMVAWSVALASLALVGGQSVYWSAVAMFVLGLTGAIGNVEFGTYLVRNAPDDMIARITGIGQMLAIGACALGPVLGGYAIQHFQIKGAVWILLAIVMSLAFAALLMPETPRRSAPIFRAIKHVMASGRHALSANPMVSDLVPLRSADACPERNHERGHDAIMRSEPILLRNENGRLLSSIDQPALTCGDAG